MITPLWEENEKDYKPQALSLKRRRQTILWHYEKLQKSLRTEETKGYEAPSRAELNLWDKTLQIKSTLLEGKEAERYGCDRRLGFTKERVRVHPGTNIRLVTDTLAQDRGRRRLSVHLEGNRWKHSGSGRTIRLMRKRLILQNKTGNNETK